MRRSVFFLLVAVSVWLVHAEAVTRDNFLMRTTQDLVDVCSVKPGEPLYEAAVGFCHGFGVGAYQYYQAETAASASDRFVCPPEPVPARTDIVQWFIAWAREHPQYLNERPVDGLFRFLGDTWPCRR